MPSFHASFYERKHFGDEDPPLLQQSLREKETESRQLRSVYAAWAILCAELKWSGNHTRPATGFGAHASFSIFSAYLECALINDSDNLYYDYANEIMV